jgi:hypothetical protein
MKQANMVNIVNILWMESIIQYRKWKKEGEKGNYICSFRGTTGTTAKVTIGNNGETRRGAG